MSIDETTRAAPRSFCMYHGPAAQDTLASRLPVPSARTTAAGLREFEHARPGASSRPPGPYDLQKPGGVVVSGAPPHLPHDPVVHVRPFQVRWKTCCGTESASLHERVLFTT